MQVSLLKGSVMVRASIVKGPFDWPEPSLLPEASKATALIRHLVLFLVRRGTAQSALVPAKEPLRLTSLSVPLEPEGAALTGSQVRPLSREYLRLKLAAPGAASQSMGKVEPVGMVSPPLGERRLTAGSFGGLKLAHWSSLLPLTILSPPVGAGLFSLHCRLREQILEYQ